MVQWQDRLEAAGVEYTPIRDMEMGYHLNLRDPDGIALELFAPNEVYSAALAQAASRDVTQAELAEVATRLIGDEYVVKVGAPTAAERR